MNRALARELKRARDVVLYLRFCRAMGLEARDHMLHESGYLAGLEFAARQLERKKKPRRKR